MSVSARNSPGDEGVEVVKWYTRARRFPQLVGKTPNGGPIWGGPYTYTQVGVGVGLIVLGSKTAWLWGQFGLIGNAVILFGVTYGVVLLIGRLPAGSRNPLSAGAGLIRALSPAPQGRLGGVRVRLRRPHRVARSRVVISRATPTPPAGPGLAPRALERPKTRRVRLPRPRRARPSPSPIPISVPRAAPALTGVQRLLASAGAAQED